MEDPPLDTPSQIRYNVETMTEDTAYRITLHQSLSYLRTPISGDPPLESYSASFLAEAYEEQENMLVFDPYLDWEKAEPVVPRQTLKTSRANLKEIVRVKKRGGEPIG
jgi:hypothetical protein